MKELSLRIAMASWGAGIVLSFKINYSYYAYFLVAAMFLLAIDIFLERNNVFKKK